MKEEKIGITIITGFLGAGKTSLLNRIIKNEHTYKFAVIENEFAEIGIDSEIIKGIDKYRIVELSNGCVCCTKNGELQETLNELLSSNFEFNHLIIETTGIAKPDAIVQSIVANEYLKNIFYVDSVICVVDAVNFFDNLLQTEAVEQILMADTIIINKIDKTNYSLIQDNLFNINTLCRVIPSMYSDYKEHNIIASRSFSEAEFIKSFKVTNSCKPHSDKLHLKSMALNLAGSFDRAKFTDWVEYFLHLNQSSIYRIKGVLSFSDTSRKQIFQAVKTAFSIENGNFWSPNDSRSNQIILIGKDLNSKSIANELNLLMD